MNTDLIVITKETTFFSLVPVVMSRSIKTNKNGPLPIEDTAMAMAAEDMTFLVDCLKNPIGGGLISVSDIHSSVSKTTQMSLYSKLSHLMSYSQECFGCLL